MTTGPMPTPSVARDGLSLGRQLGDGGQGTVFEIVGQPTLVYKEFHSETVDASALRDLVRSRAALEPRQRSVLDSSFAWPQYIVDWRGQIVGMLMERIPREFFGQTAAGPKPRELSYLVYPPSPMWQGMGQITDVQRWELARSIAGAVAMIHRLGFVLGDISYTNLICTLSPAARVFVIDCDSARSVGSPSAHDQVQTIDWDDPAQVGEPVLDTDRYKLALAIGRLLSSSPVARPGQTIDVAAGAPHQSTPARIQRLWRRAAGRAGTRPTAHEWARSLGLASNGIDR